MPLYAPITRASGLKSSMGFQHEFRLDSPAGSVYTRMLLLRELSAKRLVLSLRVRGSLLNDKLLFSVQQTSRGQVGDLFPEIRNVVKSPNHFRRCREIGF